MTTIGFHASHEQVHPTKLVDAVIHAEQAGFTAAMCSDHLAPWSERQGHSAFAWSWLGAALQATSLPFGIVNAPGQRYHPAIIAQAIATLGAMYPGRFWAALGSGENANEHVTGAGWPAKPLREQRLLECVAVIRSLLAGDEVTHDGLVRVDRAKVWTLPEVTPKLIGAAVTEKTAGWVADWADGLITVNQPAETLKKVLNAYESAGGTGTTALQIHVSWAPTQAEAEAIAYDQWRSNVFGPPLSWDLDSPEAFDEAATGVTLEQVRESVFVSSDLGAHAAYLRECADLGFDQLYIHHVGQEQSAFIDAYGSRVLPQLETT